MTAAVVLAGGRSTRMGTPKPDLPWHGTTLLRRVTGLLGRVCAPVVVVVAPGQDPGALPDGVEVALDERPGRGPLEGLAAGLRALDGRAEAAYVSSADVPLLHPAFVAAVVGALDGADVALPEIDGHTQQLAACYRTSLLADVEALLAQDRLRPFFLFERCTVRRLTRSDLLADARLARLDPQLGSLRNLNTPGDYEAALAEPEPEVVVRGYGTFRARLGGAPRRVRAATVAGALARLDLGASAGPGLVALNGEQLGRDGSTPLAAGDELAILDADAGG